MGRARIGQRESRRSTRKSKPWGVRILSRYAVLGPYDFVYILDVPNNKMVSKVAIELSARGC